MYVLKIIILSMMFFFSIYSWSVLSGPSNRLPSVTVTGNNIELTNIPENDDNTYRCIAHNEQGIIATRAMLTVAG